MDDDRLVMQRQSMVSLIEQARADLRQFHNLRKEARDNGIRIGDLIEKLIKYFKLDELLNIPENCPGCIKRKAVFNQLRLTGWKIEWERLKNIDNS